MSAFRYSLASLFLTASCALVSVALLRWLRSESVAGAEAADVLDLTGYRLVFDEEFDAPLDVSAWGPNTRWIAHTPWHGDFGDAAFGDPGDPAHPSPFAVSGGVLKISASKKAIFARHDPYKRAWRSGLLASNASDGSGFAAQYGYFEIAAKLPTGVGVWPAFWLKSTSAPATDAGPPGSVIEIDVMEYYGRPDRYEQVVHVWGPGPHREVGNHSVMTPINDAARKFHRYGVNVTRDVLLFYYDRKLVWSVQTPPEHRKPLMLLINLALGSGFPIDKVPNPAVMMVEYVKVYAPPS